LTQVAANAQKLVFMHCEATALFAALGGMKDLLDVKSDATR
jgi:hypothetical protein